jgi:Flp pilus assembly protein TadG
MRRLGHHWRALVRRSVGRLRDATGANMIEAAIVTPLLVLLTFSIVEFGSIFYVYLALENGVAQATRFAVTGNTTSGMSRTDSIKAAMRDATPTLTIPDGAFAFSHMAPGGSSWLGGVGGPNDIEKVSVTYTWSVVTPLMRPFFTNGQITLTVDSAMKNEGRFQ